MKTLDRLKRPLLRGFLPISTAASIYLHRQTPSGQSRVYRVTQLRTHGVHGRESAGIGQVVFKVVPVTGVAFAGHHGPVNVRLSFPHPLFLRPKRSRILFFARGFMFHSRFYASRQIIVLSISQKVTEGGMKCCKRCVLAVCLAVLSTQRRVVLEFFVQHVMLSPRRGGHGASVRAAHPRREPPRSTR